jgi:hypothetical protein
MKKAEKTEKPRKCKTSVGFHPALSLGGIFSLPEI